MSETRRTVDSAPASSSRVLRWFERSETPIQVVRMGELATVLREVNDLLHAADPGADDLLELTRLAEALRDRARNLPVAPAQGFDPVEDDPDAIGFNDRSPLTGEVNPIAPPLRMERAGDHVIGRAIFGRTYEGPPGHVHGGWVASGFDEVMGMVQAMTGAPGMTGKLEVSYRRPTPLGVELVFDGWVEEVRGRKIFTRAVLTSDGTVLAEATGLFVSVDFDAMRASLASGSDG
jgi:acyl-coenzyme A thioesterase PaaI-like protein